MADHSTIEWTDSTWNPITGCSIVSPGCRVCYAMKLAGTRLKHHPSRKGLTTETKNGPVWSGEVRFNEYWLEQPLKWARPRMVFVCAHGDLFHENVPDEWIDRVFDVMGRASQHTFQVLTKRSARMRAWAEKATVDHHLCGGDGCNYCGDYAGRVPWKLHPFPNVWLGTSAERQKEADERIPDLLNTPAAVHFVSLEPLLGEINLARLEAKECETFVNSLTGAGAHDSGDTWSGPSLDWIIVGGESGADATPMHPQWVRSLRDQCAVADKLGRFFFKQWGAWHSDALLSTDLTGACPPANMMVGKKKAGRLLDGIEHNGMPV